MNYVNINASKIITNDNKTKNTTILINNASICESRDGTFGCCIIISSGLIVVSVRVVLK